VEQEAKGAAKKTWDVCVGCIKGMFNIRNKSYNQFHQLQPGRYIFGDYLTTAGVEYCGEQAA